MGALWAGTKGKNGKHSSYVNNTWHFFSPYYGDMPFLTWRTPGSLHWWGNWKHHWHIGCSTNDLWEGLFVLHCSKIYQLLDHVSLSLVSGNILIAPETNNSMCFFFLFLMQRLRRLSPFFIPRILINMASGHVSMKYGFQVRR